MSAGDCCPEKFISSTNGKKLDLKIRVLAAVIDEESDMQNYYDTIEEKQESVLRPIYDKLLPIMAMSALGAVPDDLDFEFNAVRRPDEDEMSDLASKNTDSVTKAFQAGLISQRTALKELRSQSEITGMWTKHHR